MVGNFLLYFLKHLTSYPLKLATSWCPVAHIVHIHLSCTSSCKKILDGYVLEFVSRNPQECYGRYITLIHIWLGWSLTSGVAWIPKLPDHSNLHRPCSFSMACEHSRLQRTMTSMYSPRPYFLYSERSRFVEFG